VNEHTGDECAVFKALKDEEPSILKDIIIEIV